MVFVYVLQLEHSKYYIGKTTNPINRINQHFNGNGSNWTKMHKPIQLIEVVPECNEYDEDRICHFLCIDRHITLHRYKLDLPWCYQ
jgi:hypothetical protein